MKKISEEVFDFSESFSEIRNGSFAVYEFMHFENLCGLYGKLSRSQMKGDRDG